MKNRLNWLGFVGLGAALMYVFDPFIGRRRRAIARDKMIRFGHKTSDALDVTSRDLKNRVVGAAAQVRGMISREDVSDEQLAQRVRAKLGGWISHPGSIEVRADDGRVVLSGPILAHEVDHLLKRVASIRGVRSVENRLEVHESAESIPGLQGQVGRRKSGEQLDIMQASWSPSTRLIAGTFGAGIAAYGAKRLSGVGVALTGLGAAMVARSLANMEFKRLFVSVPDAMRSTRRKSSTSTLRSSVFSSSGPITKISRSSCRMFARCGTSATIVLIGSLPGRLERLSSGPRK